MDDPSIERIRQYQHGEHVENATDEVVAAAGDTVASWETYVRTTDANDLLAHERRISDLRKALANLAREEE
jgi:hypothetical protein